ncbi:signal recognition particle subunit [Tilletia horrida]|nr:signal recognition particle subunit [Tilletia horrida]KAK0567586.1 signal recognition particle subunit [Tilletia horrida]
MPTVEDFDDDFEFELPTPPPAASASGSTSAVTDGATLLSHSGSKAPTSEETKEWLCIYPIYFDAKRKYRGGCRRVRYDDAALYPQSIHLAHACQLLGVKFNHELYKTHPQDWENPGRVKVQLHKEDGTPYQAHLSNKQELLKAMAKLIQPIAGGKPPPLLPSNPPTYTDPKAQDKQQSNEKKKKEGAKPQPAPLLHRQRKIRKVAHKRGFRLAQAPEDDSRFSIQSMLPPHSPALEVGALNINMGKAMGAAGQGLGGGMGALGGMLSGLGLGGDDEEDEQEEVPKVDKPLTPLEKQQQMIAQMGRRQRKKVVRIGR